MSVFHTFENTCSCYLHREPVFLRSSLSCSFYSPLAHALVSDEDYINFEFSNLYPRSIPVSLLRLFCLNRHYHFNHHQYHPFPLSLLPSADFSDAAAGLFFLDLAEAELYFRSIGDQLATPQLGNDRDIGLCIGDSESKWKGTAEIKGKKGDGITQKCSGTAEEKGVFKKSMKWTVEYQGKGKFVPLSRMYPFSAPSVSTQDFYERTKKEKEVKRVMSRLAEIDDGTDQQVISNIKASVKKTVHRRRGKKKEQSPQDAAMAIQKTFRDYLLRRSQVIHSLRGLAVVKSKLREIRVLFSKFSYRYRLSKDAEERQLFSEKIIILLLTVDAIEGQDLLVRSAKRSMTRELEAVLEVVDPQPYRELGSRQPKFDLLATSFSTEIASGVADVVRMLDQEDSSSSSIILPNSSL